MSVQFECDVTGEPGINEPGFEVDEKLESPEFYFAFDAANEATYSLEFRTQDNFAGSRTNGFRLMLAHST